MEQKKIQSTTRIKAFLVVSIMSGILVGFVILVGTKSLGKTTLHFIKDQFQKYLVANRPWMANGAHQRSPYDPGTQK